MKHLPKYLLVGISLALGSGIMSAMDSKCTDPNLAFNAMRIVSDNIGVNLYEQAAMDILKDNPSITGPEIARLRSWPAGIFGYRRNLLRAIWNIRRPLIDSGFAQIQDLLTAENNGQGCTLSPQKLLIFEGNRELAIKSLQAISQMTGCPLQIIDLDSIRQYVGEEQQQIRAIFEKARETAMIQTVAPQQSFMTRLLPSFAHRWIYGTSDNSCSKSKPRLRPIICITDISKSGTLDDRFNATLTTLLVELEQNKDALVVAVRGYERLDKAIGRRAQFFDQDSVNPSPLFEERTNILEGSLSQLAGPRLDLAPTIFELAQRTRGFTYGQLLQLMDEIAFEATLSGEAIERGHIIAVYNRTRAEMRGNDRH